jgi:uncharacterized surface protein with fasciclin (FAS1) repeats
LLNIYYLVMFNIQYKPLNITAMKTNETRAAVLIMDKGTHSALTVKAALLALIMIFFVNTLMAQKTVVDIVVESSTHTTLEAAVIAAELADDLQGNGPFTLFAPTDAAFQALPEGTVASLLEDPTGALANILLYHVAGAKAYAKDLSDGQKIATLQGDEVMVKFKNGKAYINNAMVSVADIKADNGVVHVIDAVLVPSDRMASAAQSASIANSGACGN